MLTHEQENTLLVPMSTQNTSSTTQKGIRLTFPCARETKLKSANEESAYARAGTNV